jgi:uncharacterized membrane protein YkvA (DUF1232 family)
MMPTLIDQLKQKGKHLKRETTALYFAYRDPRTPWYARAFSALVVAYLLSPIDLIPDFIPILGYLDDLVLVPLGIRLALKMIPQEVMADARKSADEPVQNKTIGVVFTLLILCGWALILFFILSAVYIFLTHKN